MQNDAFQRIAIIVPRRPLQRARRVGITCFPTYTNTRGAKVDIFGVVFVVEPRRKKSHDVHLRPAAIFGQILDNRVIALALRYEFDEL